MRIRTPSDLARLVKNARIQRDLTQQEVAASVRITRQSLARIERGHGGASFDTVLRILDYLDVRLGAIADRHATDSAAPVTSGAAQAAAEALAQRTIPLVDSGALGPLHTQVPGSVIIKPLRAVEADSQALAEVRADADPDAAPGIE